MGGRCYRWSLVATALSGLGAASACIIPDLKITEQREISNPGAVRIVEPTPISAAAQRACDAVPFFSFCPSVFDTLPSGELKGQGDLCVCPARNRDDNAPQGFEIFVEDPDTDEFGAPKDDIFGAFLLDVPPGATDLTQYQAFTNAMPPDEPAPLNPGEVRAIERDAPGLRVFRVAGFTGGAFDVCNDNDGAKLDFGLHELRFVATDRPWYAPADPGAADEGEVMRGDPLIGVPDLEAGATYASAAFVFRCLDSTLQEVASCACFDPEPPA